MIPSDVALTLGSDERTFVLRGVNGQLTVPGFVQPNTLVSVFEDGDSCDVWVGTGSQWGPFDVRVRVLDGPAAMPDDVWQDVVEFSVACRTGIDVCEMVDGPVGPLVTEGGTFRVRVSASGRSEGAATDVEIDEADDVEPVAVEHYLLEVWRADAAAAVVWRETSDFATGLLHPPEAAPVSEEELAGVVASVRILADVEGAIDARIFSGNRGTVTVSRDVPGTRRRAFERAAYVVGWPLCRGGMLPTSPLAPPVPTTAPVSAKAARTETSE